MSEAKEDEQTKSLANSAACLTPGGTQHKPTKSMKIQEGDKIVLSHGDVVSLFNNKEAPLLGDSDQAQSKVDVGEQKMEIILNAPDYVDDKVQEPAATTTSGETFIKPRNPQALISFGSADESH
jgi:hypothetical protein